MKIKDLIKNLKEFDEESDIKIMLPEDLQDDIVYIEIIEISEKNDEIFIKTDFFLEDL